MIRITPSSTEGIFTTGFLEARGLGDFLGAGFLPVPRGFFVFLLFLVVRPREGVRPLPVPREDEREPVEPARRGLRVVVLDDPGDRGFVLRVEVLRVGVLLDVDVLVRGCRVDVFRSVIIIGRTLGL